MNLDELTKRALEIKFLYSNLEARKSYKKWTEEETYEGLVSDVGDLGRLVLAKEGYREMPHIEEKLSHELAEILWSTLLLADSYGVDLKKAFLDEMTRLERKLTGDAVESVRESSQTESIQAGSYNE